MSAHSDQAGQVGNMIGKQSPSTRRPRPAKEPKEKAAKVSLAAFGTQLGNNQSRTSQPQTVYKGGQDRQADQWVGTIPSVPCFANDFAKLPLPCSSRLCHDKIVGLGMHTGEPLGRRCTGNRGMIWDKSRAVLLQLLDVFPQQVGVGIEQGVAQFPTPATSRRIPTPGCISCSGIIGRTRDIEGMRHNEARTGTS